MEYPITSILSSVAYNTNNINLEILNKKNNNMIQFYQIMDDNIDIDKLSYAFNIILHRHKVLTSSFFEKQKNGKKMIYGRIRDDINLEIERYTPQNFNNFIRPFDITKDLLIRVGIIEKSVLMIDMDHKVSDGFSCSILIKELFKIYNGENLDELYIQYSDYAIHYHDKMNSKDYSKQIEYYRNIFNYPCSNIIEKTKCDNENNDKNKCIKHFKTITFNTDKETYYMVEEITKMYNLTKTSLFLTIYSLVLSIYSGQKDVFIAVMNSNRTNIHTENLIGLFVKFIPVLVHLENNSLIDSVKKCMSMLLTLFSYDISFSKVSEELNLPLCNTWFRFHPYAIIENDEINLLKTITYNDIYTIFNEENKLKTDTLIDNKPADFQLVVTELKDYYEILFQYNEDIYNINDVQNILNNFVSLLRNENYLNFKLNEIIENLSSFNGKEVSIDYQKHYNENQNSQQSIIRNNDEENSRLLEHNIKKNNKKKNQFLKYLIKLKKFIFQYKNE